MGFCISLFFDIYFEVIKKAPVGALRKNRLTVSVLVFGKPTPIELSLTQVEKG